MSELKKIYSNKDVAQILENMNIKRESSSQTYTCDKCKDKGYIFVGDKVRVCSCRKSREEDRLKKNAGIPRGLADCSFEKFDLSFYSNGMSKNGINYREGAEKVLKAAKEFVVQILKGEEPQGLLLQGDVGSGKTFLAAAIANSLAVKNVDLQFVVVPDLLDEIRNSYNRQGDDKEEAIMSMVKNTHVLILDDLGAHNYTEWSIKTIFAVINYRLNHRLPMVITTNLSAEERDRLLGARINSRLFECCRLFRIGTTEDIRIAAQKRAMKENR